MAGLKVNSQPVNQEKALTVARNFYYSSLIQENNLKSASSVTFEVSQTIPVKSEDGLKSARNIPAIHIVNMNNNGGFILVSGDERMQPILGYSTNGSFHSEELPEHIRSFFSNLQEEISSVIANDQNNNLESNNKWDELENGYTKSGSFYEKFNLVSTTWGQGKYYNDMCPEDSKIASSAYNGHVPAGCVATVMSQILNFWSWPRSGSGNVCYTPTANSEYGEQCADFESAVYNYSSLPSMANEQNNEIAQLVYHTAVAVKMNFSPTGSSAFSSTTAKAFINNFKFSEKAEFVYKSDYTDTEWVELLKTQLNNGIPLFYRGDKNGSSAHAFICDGYDPENRFHFNWGWEGRCDGFFAVTALEPSNNYNYTSNQGAIINLFPLNNDFCVEDLKSKTSDFNKNEELNFSYTQKYNGSDFYGFPVSFEYWLSTDNTIDGNDILLGYDETNMSSEFSNNPVVKNLSIPEDIEEGEYFLIIKAVSEETEDINDQNNTQALLITIKNASQEAGSSNLFTCSDELEPNNGDYEAVWIGDESNFFNENLCLPEGDEDWFEFVLNSETYFARIAMADESSTGYYGVKFNFTGDGVEILTFETEGISDTKIWLYDSGLNQIAEDDNGGVDPFARVFYRQGSSTTSASIFETGNINIYPNPVKQKVFINSDIHFTEDITVALLDIRGNLLETKTFENSFYNDKYSLDLTPYSDGQYIIRIYSANGEFTARKILKNS
ncbi:MAG: thiol protease/hemagglutinin PrtT [Prolixibacteraceae bacterium]|nr:thiol protease/hemagglutinin PrtT [Prolixibacteraceae bacterium]